MKIRVERDGFADAVAWAARILPQKAAMPVLAGLRIEAGPDGNLVLSGFDYEVSAQAELDVTVAEAGAILVPGRLLAEITRSLAPQPIDLATDGSRVVLSCGSSTSLCRPCRSMNTPRCRQCRRSPARWAAMRLRRRSPRSRSRPGAPTRCRS